MRFHARWLLTPLVCLLLATPALAVNAFQDEALNYLNEICSARRVRKLSAVLCYYQIKIDKLESRVDELESNVEALMSNSSSSLQPIGANLKAYSQPKDVNCDVTVPIQITTIQSAINSANTGDTICVNEGTYNENVTINKSIRLSGLGTNETSIINGQSSDYFGTVRIEANNVVLEGFKIQGVGIDFTTSPVILAESTSGVSVQFNHIKAGNGEVVLRTDGFQNNQMIQHNILEGNNSPQIVMINGTPTVGKESNQVSLLFNTFSGSVKSIERDDTGVALVLGAANSLMKSNVFNLTGEIKTLVINASSSNLLNTNNFNSTVTTKVKNSVETLNAENNWWGDTDPSDNIQGDVDYTPFTLIAYPEY